VNDRARRLHHHLARTSEDGVPTQQENPDFCPIRSLSEFLAPPIDEMEERQPFAELLDPSPTSARNVVKAAASGRVGDPLTEELCLATSEAVTNAIVHGTPPVSVRVWVAPGKVAVHVRDPGPGPADPVVGLRGAPAMAAASGRGLWMVHRLDIGTSLHVSDGGFAVRLFAAQTPHLATAGAAGGLHPGSS
jgi:anti-sigma regulatory factor (Ser/Thr protein kinase)